MNWLSQLSVRFKLALLLAVLSLGIVLVAGTSLWRLRQTVQLAQELSTREVQAVQALGDVRAGVGNLRRFEKDMFLNLADEQTLARYHTAWLDQRTRVLERLDGLGQILDGQEHDALGALRGAIERYSVAVEAIRTGIERGEINDPWAANKAMEPAKTDIRAADASLERIVQAVAQRVATSLVRMGEMEQRAMFASMLVAAAVLALALALGCVIAQCIVDPLQQAVRAIERVAEGDLSHPLTVWGADETARVLQGVQRMQTALTGMIRELRTAAENINTASGEIASGNQNLSARTEQAASNLQETAASIEELTSTVRHSADAARQAKQLAANASEIAVRGGQVVSQVVATMQEIHHSSQKINDIIGVIDGIAFQTNILALNAAVEAARAGEQGRGFAVVAAEVRGLAQRSAEAAKEIKGLIGASVLKVDAGSRLVVDAGQTMSAIVGSVQRVSAIIGEITAAAGEQSEGIGQVNTAVNQLDQMTQQNAALVEESAAASESLKAQARRLAGVVMTFRLPP